jgi:hypothetical protein
MTTVAAYHTNSPEYPPQHREVYHDKDTCSDRKRIKQEHQEKGTGKQETLFEVQRGQLDRSPAKRNFPMRAGRLIPVEHVPHTTEGHDWKSIGQTNRPGPRTRLSKSSVNHFFAGVITMFRKATRPSSLP